MLRRESKTGFGERAVRARRRSRNNVGGTQLAEFGPAMLLLFMSTFLPLVLLIAVGVSYGAGYTLNNLQLREAQVSKKSEATSLTGNVMKAIPDAWQSDGIGRFTSLDSPPVTKVTYKNGQIDTQGRQDMIVVVTTTIHPKPILNGMPFIPGIPGLTAPSDFTYENEAVIENPDDFNQ